ncbi:uncharacterized protein MICPUCDRAFT_12286, partial [Micromonas pusilla CCMP1545]
RPQDPNKRVGAAKDGPVGPKPIPNAKGTFTRQGSVLGRETEDINEHYKFHNELGKGAYGTTFLVSHKVTGKKYACKSISKRKLISKDEIDDVRREISVLHHLSGHPNIVGLVQAFEGSKHIYIVMDLCTGGELFDRIVERGNYTEQDAAAVFRTMIKSCQYWHSLGVVHRDLKPENFVLKTKDYDAPIMAIDFGLSAYWEPGQPPMDIFCGSAFYMAPEIFNKKYDAGVDIWACGVILYILLSGGPPFIADTDKGIQDMILACKYDLAASRWPKISASAKDLIRKMLMKKPKDRLTAEEVLNHPWVREDGDAPATKIEDEVLSRMKNFSAMNKFKKLGLMAMARTMTKEEILGLKELFQSFDEDGSGTVTIKEFQKGLAKKGTSTTAAEVQQLLNTIDVDASGEIDYQEFIASTLSAAKFNSEENIARAFAYFDTDNSGYITVDELKKVIKENNVDVDATNFLDEVDKNNDGRVDYDEFLAMMTKEDKPKFR